MEKMLVLREYPRLKFSVENKIPVSLCVYPKREVEKTMGKNYVENDEYWLWQENVQVFNLYELFNNIKKNGNNLSSRLEEIFNQYDIDAGNLTVSYYEKNGLDKSLQEFYYSVWDRIPDKQELEQRLVTWKEINKQSMKITKNIYKRLTEHQKWLQKESDVMKLEAKTSPINITSVELEGKVMLISEQNGQVVRHPISVKNGFDLFLNSFASYEVPFISYRSSQTYLKVYDGEMDISLEKIKPSDLDIEEEDTINAIVLADKFFTKPTLDSYTHVKINLKANSVTFSTKNIKGEKPITAVRLEEHLPIVIERLTEKNIFGEYYIYNLNLNQSLFVDMLMNDPIAREFIYMDESSSFLSIKKKKMFRLREPNIHFTGETGDLWNRYFSFIIHQEEVVKAETKPFIDYEKGDKQLGYVSLTARMPYIKVVINKAGKREDLQLGLLMFTRFLNLYQKREEKLLQEFRNFGIKFRKLKSYPLKVVDKKVTNVDKDEYIENLQDAAPHIFATNYAAEVCQLPDQPVVIPPKMVEEWNEEKTDVYQRAVPFPPLQKEGGGEGEPEIFLGCGFRNPNKPYVNIKEHKLSNKNEYPYLPCCTSKNMQEPGSHSLFTHYYLGEEYINNEAITTSVIKSRKLLRKGQDGILNPIIPSTFKILGLMDKEETLWRFGVSFSEYSAFRCLLYVKQDKTFMKYFNLKEFGRKEEDELNEYIQGLLKSRKIEPGLLSQELYGLTPEEIAIVENA